MTRRLAGFKTIQHKHIMLSVARHLKFSMLLKTRQKIHKKLPRIMVRHNSYNNSMLIRKLLSEIKIPIDLRNMIKSWPPLIMTLELNNIILPWIIIQVINSISKAFTHRFLNTRGISSSLGYYHWLLLRIRYTASDSTVRRLKARPPKMAFKGEIFNQQQKVRIISLV